MHLQGIMVVVFIILDWMLTLMNTTAVIPCRHISRKLGIVWFKKISIHTPQKVNGNSKKNTI